jgi:hypothetical protein
MKHRLIARINITANETTGTIPTSIGTCSSLSMANLAGNKLSGAITTELGDLSWLNSLDISRKKLSGTVLASLATCRTEIELPEPVGQSARGGPAGGARHLGLWGELPR